MAKESICRNCFHSCVCEQFNENKDDNNEKCHFFNDHYVSTADVVPRAEYEKAIIDMNAARLGMIAEHERLNMAKAEVTREIFEEIEKAHDECIWIDITTRIGYLQQTKFEHKLAELKKKYTEGEG